MQTLNDFTDVDHEQFMNQGYLRLGQVLSVDELTALQRRIEDIMMGRVRYENMRLQEVGKKRTIGNKEATLSYRRIDDLEQDPLETNDLSEAHPDVLQQLMERLAFFNRTHAPDISGARFDNASCPKPPNIGVWMPWRKDGTG